MARKEDLNLIARTQDPPEQIRVPYQREKELTSPNHLQQIQTTAREIIYFFLPAPAEDWRRWHVKRRLYGYTAVPHKEIGVYTVQYPQDNRWQPNAR